MILTRYGLREWLSITIVAAILAAAAIWLQIWWALAIIVIVWLALLSFFRDPPRNLPANLSPGDMISPADGTVSAVLRVENHVSVSGGGVGGGGRGGPAVIVRIFLSVLNVHVNRSPCDSIVVALRHTPGKYLNAQLEESAAVNESNLIMLRLDWDQRRADRSDTDQSSANQSRARQEAATSVTRSSEVGNATAIDRSLTVAAPTALHQLTEFIGVRQVAGMLARRIVCPLNVGDRLTRGQKFGMIKFGSTTELILPRPDDVTVHVRKGDKVKGGLTVLATLRPPLES